MMKRLLLIPILLAVFLSLAFWTDPDGGPSVQAAQDRSPVRFAVIGDFGSGSQREADVARLIAAWEPDFILTAGDNRYGATTYDQVIGQFFCDWLKDVKPGKFCAGGNASRNAFFPAPGNHDYSDGRGFQEYLTYFTLPGAAYPNTSGNERYYDVRWGPVHAFILNSNPGEPDGVSPESRQGQWLKAQLASSTAPWQIVILHHAPYSSSASHGSSLWMQWPFAAWGADAVIGGHDHTYERLQVNGIPYFVNGIGGMSLYNFGAPLPESVKRYNRDYGAMLVEADDARLSFRFVNRQGETIDSYELAPQAVAPKPTPPVPFHWSWETSWSAIRIEASEQGWTISLCLFPKIPGKAFCKHRLIPR